MKTLIPTLITKNNFSLYGQYFSLDNTLQPDSFSMKAGSNAGVPISRPLKLGLTYSKGGAFICSSMERHKSTEELLFPGEHPMILAVCADPPDSQPYSEHIQAFLIPPGTAVCLYPGIWHDACHGLYADSYYYFMAHNNGAPDETRWFPVFPEAVNVQSRKQYLFPSKASIFKEAVYRLEATFFTRTSDIANHIIFQKNEVCTGNSWKCWMTDKDCMATPGQLVLCHTPVRLVLEHSSYSIFCGNFPLFAHFNGNAITLLPGELLEIQPPVIAQEEMEYIPDNCSTIIEIEAADSGGIRADYPVWFYTIISTN